MNTLLTAALVATSVSGAYAPSPDRSAVILRFAVASDPHPDFATLPAQACLQSTPVPRTGSDSTARVDLKVDPQILDAIANELQTRLSKKMPVTMDTDPKTIPLGALVISGCITRADPGDAKGRLIGMGLGMSHLEAHVKILSKREAGFVPVDEFDVQAQGGKVLPPLGPIGLAAHAVAEPHETLSADAVKLADALLKKLAEKLKSPADTAKTA